jgi:Xaa-Pro aminopeptidase
VSGFTGSAGLCVVTHSQAALWTDGRYFLQASKQLDENWILQKSGMPGVPTKEEWLNQVLPPKSTVGVDPKLFTVSAARSLKKELSKSSNTIAWIHDNLVDNVWADRPKVPRNPVFPLDIKFSGKSDREFTLSIF